MEFDLIVDGEFYATYRTLQDAINAYDRGGDWHGKTAFVVQITYDEFGMYGGNTVWSYTQ